MPAMPLFDKPVDQQRDHVQVDVTVRLEGSDGRADDALIDGCELHAFVLVLDHAKVLNVTNIVRLQSIGTNRFATGAKRNLALFGLARQKESAQSCITWWIGRRKGLHPSRSVICDSECRVRAEYAIVLTNALYYC